MKTIPFPYLTFKSASVKKPAMILILFFMLFSELSQAQVPMIRLKMHGLPNYLDETVLYYQAGATDGFDSEYDAYKLSGQNSVPQISQEYNSLLMSINGVSPVASTFSINIKTTTNATGNFTITASDFTFLPLGSCVRLNDLVTGASVNILAGPYVFNLSNTSTTSSRFVLAITHYDLPITSELIQPTCQLLNDGKFKVKGDIQGPWNYKWKDSTGTTIQTTIASSEWDSISSLSVGSYTVEITSASNTCYANITSFSINEKIAPVVSFTSPDTLLASMVQNFLPTNLSLNSESFSWSFGDGIGNSADYEPVYCYSTPGTYEVKLTGSSSTGCIDSITKIIKVIDLTTSVNSIGSNHTIKLLNTGDNTYLVKINSNSINEINLNLYDLQGKVVLNEQVKTFNGSNNINLDLNKFSQGIYVLNISDQTRILNCSKLFIK